MAVAIIITVVFGMFALVAVNLFKNRKKGGGCSGGCSGCSSAGNCMTGQTKVEKPDANKYSQFTDMKI